MKNWKLNYHGQELELKIKSYVNIFISLNEIKDLCEIPKLFCALSKLSTSS